MKNILRNRLALSTVVTTLIILVVSVLLAGVVTYFAINVTSTTCSRRKLALNQATCLVRCRWCSISSSYYDNQHWRYETSSLTNYSPRSRSCMDQYNCRRQLRLLRPDNRFSLIRPNIHPDVAATDTPLAQYLGCCCE